jgi:hypothetical protein
LNHEAAIGSTLQKLIYDFYDPHNTVTKNYSLEAEKSNRRVKKVRVGDEVNKNSNIRTQQKEIRGKYIVKTRSL